MEGEARLAGGPTANEGRLEICLGGIWGSVCDVNWGAFEARVACRQLGQPLQRELSCEFKKSQSFFIADAEALYRFGGGSGPIHYSGFQCSGVETELAKCTVERNASLFQDIGCVHNQDAGVRCRNGKPLLIPCETTLSAVFQILVMKTLFV